LGSTAAPPNNPFPQGLERVLGPLKCDGPCLSLPMRVVPLGAEGCGAARVGETSMNMVRRLSGSLTSCLLAAVLLVLLGDPALSVTRTVLISSTTQAVIYGQQCVSVSGGSRCDDVAIFAFQFAHLEDGRKVTNQIQYYYTQNYYDSNGSWLEARHWQGSTQSTGGSAIYRSFGLNSATIKGTVVVHALDSDLNVVDRKTIRLALDMKGVGLVDRTHDRTRVINTGSEGSVSYYALRMSSRDAVVHGSAGFYSGPTTLAFMHRGRDLSTTIIRD
jgi:hypothetical protein